MHHHAPTQLHFHAKPTNHHHYRRVPKKFQTNPLQTMSVKNKSTILCISLNQSHYNSILKQNQNSPYSNFSISPNNNPNPNKIQKKRPPTTNHRAIHTTHNPIPFLNVPLKVLKSGTTNPLGNFLTTKKPSISPKHLEEDVPLPHPVTRDTTALPVLKKPTSTTCL